MSGDVMSHKLAKLLLSQAISTTEVEEAIKQAIELGMPMHEIQEYLDWVDATGIRPNKKTSQPENKAHDPGL
jgi:hypothetical protein